MSKTEIAFGCSDVYIRLPELQHELRNLLASARASLAQLPEPSENHVAKAFKTIGDFLNAVQKHLEGAPGRDGLHQSTRESFSEFVVAIRTSAPDFRPCLSSAKRSCDAIMPYPGAKVEKDQIIYLDEVKELANM